MKQCKTCKIGNHDHSNCIPPRQQPVSKKLALACWNLKSYQIQWVVPKAGNVRGQSHVTDYFDVSKFSQDADSNIEVRSEINCAVGRDPEGTVALLLLRLYKNAEANARKSKQGYRYDDVVKNFAVALYIINGTSGYELLRYNLGNSLPHVSVVQKILAKQK